MHALPHRLVAVRVPIAAVAVIAALVIGCSTSALPELGALADFASAADGHSATDGPMTPADFSVAPARDLASLPNPDLAVSCPGVFPTFDKTCASDADCFVALHQVNCCGTLVALGYDVAARAAFASAEKACDAMYPGCGCAEGPTTAEDGRTAVQGMIVVRCSTGKCNTYVP